MRTWSIGLALTVTVAAAGCGGAAEPAASPPVKAPVAASGAASVPVGPVGPLGDHALARSTVHAVVSDGLGAFLRHVDVDAQPVMSGGKFRGFRLAGLRDPQFFGGADLKTGDVITGVNGFPIERPEQAQTAFESLDVASELRVSYERDGQPRELVYAIVDGK